MKWLQITEADALPAHKIIIAEMEIIIRHKQG